MEDGLYGAIIAGAVAVLVSILSAYLGAMWGRRHERERWFRDQKLALYTEFLDQVAGLETSDSSHERKIILSKLSLAAPEEILILAEEIDNVLIWQDTLLMQMKDHPETRTAGLMGEYGAHKMNLVSALKYRMRMDLGNRVSRKERVRIRRYLKQIDSDYELTDDPKRSRNDGVSAGPDKTSKK
ncbi:hypothetical protein QF031_000955 [Pseudarthrobacter defluvii]|uniref:hypothetical protein n=1 Tax=Pseudarthrobacter defluvii TaxID=410837 RepID=UPI00277EB443|nr:hypothetical protein [Pseudarthrobacter defluvii]MDQ0768206.1 hypothetical protein [Pseudarthrobacter defluvii]